MLFLALVPFRSEDHCLGQKRHEALKALKLAIPAPPTNTTTWSQCIGFTFGYCHRPLEHSAMGLKPISCLHKLTLYKGALHWLQRQQQHHTTTNNNDDNGPRDDNDKDNDNGNAIPWQALLWTQQIRTLVNQTEGQIRKGRVPTKHVRVGK